VRNLPFEHLHEITLKEVYQKATAENSDLRKDIRLKTLRHHFGIEQIKKMDLFKSYRIVNALPKDIAAFMSVHTKNRVRDNIS
jgi:hypothetical protein